MVTDLLEHATRANRNTRVYICEQEFAVFAMYYFAEFFIYKIPGFQWLMYRALNAFTQGKFKFLLWVMFRESAKTTLAKIYVLYCIVYRKKRFINWDSYDKGNSEAALFDIATWLQTNKRILADFGQLYFENAAISAKQAKMKRVSEFVTTNRVKVKGYSTQEATRGRIFDRWRPDLYVVEDFETAKTTRSVAVTAAIVRHIDELKSGLAAYGQVIFLGNLISDSGSVAGLLQEAKENPDNWHVQQVSVRDASGDIVWPDKFVETRDQAAKVNASRPREEMAVSLEQLQKDLNSGGRKVFESEMENNPEASGELFFERARVDRDIAVAKVKKPIKEVGGLSIWEEYKAKYRYAFGGDTAKGVSRDSCASCGIKFADISTEPALVVATYSSNTIAPDDFGDEMASHGRTFGECLLAPELNNTGYATVTRLKAIYPVHRLFRQVKEEQIGKKVTKDLGWEATSANVAGIYYAFRTAYNDGQVKIFCPKLLAELRIFTKRDLEESARKTDSASLEGAVTKHFDLLRAACIAWDMRTHAVVTKPTTYKQGAYEPRSEYQGG